MGNVFRAELKKIKSPMLKSVRGKGLLNAIDVQPHKGKTAWDVCLRLRDNGLLGLTPSWEKTRKEKKKHERRSRLKAKKRKT